MFIDNPLNSPNAKVWLVCDVCGYKHVRTKASFLAGGGLIWMWAFLPGGKLLCPLCYVWHTPADWILKN